MSNSQFHFRKQPGPRLVRRLDEPTVSQEHTFSQEPTNPREPALSHERAGNHPDPAEKSRRFAERVAALRLQLKDTRRRHAAHRALEDLHLEYAVERDQDSGHVRVTRLDTPRTVGDVEKLQKLIAASLEGGLLRQSRRKRILDEAAKAGLSPFHTQLLIAQTQFGSTRVLSFDDPEQEARDDAAMRARARLTASIVLALAMFMTALRLLGV